MRSKVNAQFKLRDAGSRKRDGLSRRSARVPTSSVYPYQQTSQGPSACLKRAIRRHRARISRDRRGHHALIFSDLVERYPDRTSERLKELVQAGKACSAYDYLAAKALQEKLRTA